MLKVLRDLSMTWMMITMCSIRSLFNNSLIFFFPESQRRSNTCARWVSCTKNFHTCMIQYYMELAIHLKCPYCVCIYRIYMVILWTQFANKKLHLYLITQKHVIISLCKKVSTILLPTLNIKRFLSDFLLFNFWDYAITFSQYLWLLI